VRYVLITFILNFLYIILVYVTAYLVVVVCAFGAAMSGTVWAVFVFYKRFALLCILLFFFITVLLKRKCIG